MIIKYFEEIGYDDKSNISDLYFYKHKKIIGHFLLCWLDETWRESTVLKYGFDLNQTVYSESPYFISKNHILKALNKTKEIVIEYNKKYNKGYNKILFEIEGQDDKTIQKLFQEINLKHIDKGIYIYEWQGII